jgi:ATP-dependent Clp protease adapter protein ClpS
MASPGTLERPELSDLPSDQRDRDWLVIVYNNDFNTWAEVMAILMIATHCDEDEAYIETWEIDHLGKSVVHQSDEDEANAVAEIIRKIGIRVEVVGPED